MRLEPGTTLGSNTLMLWQSSGRFSVEFSPHRNAETGLMRLPELSELNLSVNTVTRGSRIKFAAMTDRDSPQGKRRMD